LYCSQTLLAGFRGLTLKEGRGKRIEKGRGQEGRRVEGIEGEERKGEGEKGVCHPRF